MQQLKEANEVNEGEANDHVSDSDGSSSNSGSSSESSSDDDDDNDDENDTSNTLNKSNNNNNNSSSNHTNAINRLNRTLLENDILQSLGSQDDIDTEGLSNYELLRLRNIQRNEARMAQLGLMMNPVNGAQPKTARAKKAAKMSEQQQQQQQHQHANDGMQHPMQPIGDAIHGKSNNTPPPPLPTAANSQLALYYKPKAPPIQKRWLQRYNDLKMFHSEYGHIHVPSASYFKMLYGDGATPNNTTTTTTSTTTATGTATATATAATNTNTNTIATYKTLGAWLTKQRRQYTLLQNGEKSFMDENKIKLMEKVGGKDWWVSVKNRNELFMVANGGEDGDGSDDAGGKRNRVRGGRNGRIRRSGRRKGGRNEWSEEEEDDYAHDDYDDYDDEEEDEDIAKQMMQEFENDQDDDEEGMFQELGYNDDYSSYTEEKEEEEVEIGSIDSHSEESVSSMEYQDRNNVWRHRQGQEQRGKGGLSKNGTRSDDDISRSDGRRNSNRSSSRAVRKRDRPSKSRAMYSDSSEDDEEGRSSLRRGLQDRKRRSLKLENNSYSNEDGDASMHSVYPRRDDTRPLIERNEGRMSHKLRRDKIQSPYSSMQSKEPRSRRSLSPLKSSRRKKSLLELIPTIDNEANSLSVHSTSLQKGVNDRSRSSLESSRKNLLKQAKGYSREESPSTERAVRTENGMKRRRLHDVQETVQYTTNRNVHHERSSTKRRRYDGNGESYYKNYEHHHSPDSNSSFSKHEVSEKNAIGDRRKVPEYNQKPMSEIIIAPEYQIQQTAKNYELAEGTKLERNSLMAEYGRLYGTKCLLLERKTRLEYELRELHSFIASGGISDNNTVIKYGMLESGTTTSG